MNDAPERIWLTGFVKEEYGAKLGRGTVSDVDHQGNPDYPEYIRADLVPGWQPIETAPRGTMRSVLLYSLEGEQIGFWCERFDQFLTVDGGKILWGDPTHWMPLPTPPE